jgi:hypothetical protein
MIGKNGKDEIYYNKIKIQLNYIILYTSYILQL